MKPEHTRQDSRVVVFDIMSTLLADPTRHAHEVASGLAFNDFERLRTPGIYHRLERGEISEQEYWHVLSASGITVDVDLFHSVRRNGYVWLEDMHNLVADCAAECRTVLGSNYPHWIDEVRRDHFGDLELELFASCKLGVRKPDSGFFELLCQRTGCAPEDLVLVDDKPKNTGAVSALGGVGIPFVSASSVRNALRATRVLPF